MVTSTPFRSTGCGDVIEIAIDDRTECRTVGLSRKELQTGVAGLESVGDEALVEARDLLGMLGLDFPIVIAERADEHAEGGQALLAVDDEELGTTGAHLAEREHE